MLTQSYRDCTDFRDMEYLDFNRIVGLSVDSYKLLGLEDKHYWNLEHIDKVICIYSPAMVMVGTQSDKMIAVEENNSPQ